MLDLQTILSVAIEGGASDLHLKAGLPPLCRINGSLTPIRNAPRLTAEDLKQTVASITTEMERERLERERELDLGYSPPGLGRCRVNIFYQRCTLGIVIRLISPEVRTMAELTLPKKLYELTALQRGLVLVTGATGSGKSTTLAAIVQQINETRSAHIITIEDPIEYVFRDKRSVINQRELGHDTLSFSKALRAALRQDPDVILVGELRDQETIETALLAASTGHLVLGTLHTSDAPETLNRILTVFPPHQHAQLRMQLASTLCAVVSQRLLTRKDGMGRVPAIELMINTERVRELLHDPNGIDLLHDAIAQGHSAYGMQTFDQSLMGLLQHGFIDLNEALANCTHRDDFLLRLRGVSGSDNNNWESFE